MANNLLTDLQREKEDNNDDAFYYSQPRFVHHLDNSFRNKLTNLYRLRIPRDSIVLDLMSSWVSHLPEEIKYKKVIGHGLNIQELEQNKSLDSFWIQNLNKDQKLPIEDNSIDVCLIVASWQYLQYPEEIAMELKRIVRENGQLIISFSNRAFWSKTPRIWKDGSDDDHIRYIENVLFCQGWSKPEVIADRSNKSGDILSFLGSNSDPFFSVIARK